MVLMQYKNFNTSQFVYSLAAVLLAAACQGNGTPATTAARPPAATVEPAKPTLECEYVGVVEGSKGYEFTDVSNIHAASVRKIYSIGFFDSWSGDTTFLFFNVEAPPFNDVRIQRALDYVIPYNNLPRIAECRPSWKYETSAEAAKAILAKAGYPEGISVDFLHQPKHSSEAHLIRESAEKAGIILNLKQIGEDEMFQRFASGNYSIALSVPIEATISGPVERRP